MVPRLGAADVAARLFPWGFKRSPVFLSLLLQASPVGTQLRTLAVLHSVVPRSPYRTYYLQLLPDVLEGSAILFSLSARGDQDRLP